MTNTKKIDLNSIMTKSGVKKNDSIKVNENKYEENSNRTNSIKIGSIKSEKNKDDYVKTETNNKTIEKKIILNEPKKVINNPIKISSNKTEIRKDTTIKKSENINIKNKEEKKENNTINNKSIDNSKLNNENKKNIILKNKTSENEKIKSKNETEEYIDEKSELFSNYKSDFKSDEKEIFKNINEEKKKIRKKLRLPKTRFGLLLGIMTIFSIIIGVLFIFFPESNSLSKYKTSLINAKIHYIDKPWKEKVITIDKYSFNIMIQENKKGTIYKYAGIEYPNELELKTYLNKRIQENIDEAKKLEIEKEKKYAQELKENQIKLIKTFLIKKFEK